MHRPKSFTPPWVDIFDRPCPYYNHHILGFPSFGRLPRELQLKIWEFIALVPVTQVVRIETPPQSEWRVGIFIDGTYVRRTLTYKTPAILHACFDARAAALRRYTPIFDYELGHPIYHDFETDKLEFGDLSALDTFAISTCKSRRDNLAETCWADVIDTISIRIRDSIWDRTQTLHYSCKGFRKLKQINLCITDNWLTSNGSFYPESLLLPHLLVRPNPRPSGAVIPNTYPPDSLELFNDSLRNNIKWEVHHLGGDEPQWKAPAVATAREILLQPNPVIFPLIDQVERRTQLTVSLQYMPRYGGKSCNATNMKPPRKLVGRCTKVLQEKHLESVAVEGEGKRRKVKGMLVAVLPDLLGPSWSLSQAVMDLKLDIDSY